MVLQVKRRPWPATPVFKLEDDVVSKDVFVDVLRDVLPQHVQDQLDLLVIQEPRPETETD